MIILSNVRGKSMDLVSNKIVIIIKSALKNVYNLENIDSLVMVEIPKLKDHGDFSSNIALRLAKVLKNSPINIANSLKGELENNDFIEKVEVVVPGFLNFFVKKDSLSEIINKIIDQGKDYGRNNFGKNEKVACFLFKNGIQLPLVYEISKEKRRKS